MLKVNIFILVSVEFTFSSSTILLNMIFGAILFGLTLTYILGEKMVVHRDPKYLVFPPNLGDKLQIIAGFGVPIDVPRQSLTYGLILKTNYALPNNATYFTNPYLAFAYRGVGASRWHLYRIAEAVLERLNLGGKSCLLRSVCEAAHAPVAHDGIMGELMHVILTPSSTEDEPIDMTARDYYNAERMGREAHLNSSLEDQCQLLYPNCTTSLLDFVSTVGEQVTDQFIRLFIKS